MAIFALGQSIDHLLRPTATLNLGAHHYAQNDRPAPSGVDCAQEQILCFRRCWARQPPWPVEKGKKGHDMFCSKKCLAEYMLCIGENAAERAFNSMAEAAKWLREHPGIVVGTIVLVGGVAYMVATSGSGALVLVLL